MVLEIWWVTHRQTDGWTDGKKEPVMKEVLNKAADCFKISFFRRNNNL